MVASSLFVTTHCYAEFPGPDNSGIGVGWRSKYVSEGRNNLEDGGIATIDAYLKWGNISAGFWYGNADRDSYDELQFATSYSFEIDFFEVVAGYSHILFLEDSASDNELSIELMLSKSGQIVPGLVYTYSTQSRGGFLEIFASRKLLVNEGKLVIEPYLLGGFDFGYASLQHDGANNLQAGIDLSFRLGASSYLILAANHSWALEGVKNGGLGDESWVSIGLRTEL